MVELLLEPLQYGFMQRALGMAILVGLVCAVMGSYLMVQRLALLGDVISHAVLPGVAIAFALGLPLVVGALVSGVLCTALINWVRDTSRIKEDTAMGIGLSTFFALGIVLITLIQKEQKIDLNHFLFGNILGVTSRDLWDTGLICILVLTAVALLYKELLFYSFDPLGAQAAGLPVRRLHWGLMVLVTLAIVASMRAVGVILVLALLITPGATAYLLVDPLIQVMLLGAGLGVAASVAGMYLSYYFNLPSGPGIVLVAAGLFGLGMGIYHGRQRFTSR